MVPLDNDALNRRSNDTAT